MARLTGVFYQKLTERHFASSSDNSHSLYYNKVRMQWLLPEDPVLIKNFGDVIRINTGMWSGQRIDHVFILKHDSDQVLLFTNGSNTKVVLINDLYRSGHHWKVPFFITDPIVGLVDIVSYAARMPLTGMDIWGDLKAYCERLLFRHATHQDVIKSVYFAKE